MDEFNEAVKAKLAEYQEKIDILSMNFYKSSRQWGVTFEDYKTIAVYALYEAMQSFNQNLSVKENTFFEKCIKNALIDEYNRYKRYKNNNVIADCSSSEGLEHLQNNSINNRSYGDLDSYMLIEDLKEISSNLLSHRDYIIFVKHLEGYTQSEIANKVNLSQRAVSNVLKNIAKIAKEYL
jgi:RNA polymerase sigma factor (sigma-70 family)